MAASVLTSRALHAQLSVVMAALTKAAVAEICAVVDEGYAALHAEISRSHRENEDLKKKLHLIESIVVRAEPGFVPAAESAQNAETPQQRRDSEGGDTAAAAGGEGGGVVLMQEELPDVVLIKDEDSDSNDSFDEDNQAPADGGRECVPSAPVGRGVKRHWPPGCEQADRKSSSSEPQKRARLHAGGSTRRAGLLRCRDGPRRLLLLRAGGPGRAAAAPGRQQTDVLQRRRPDDQVPVARRGPSGAGPQPGVDQTAERPSDVRSLQPRREPRRRRRFRAQGDQRERVGRRGVLPAVGGRRQRRQRRQRRLAVRVRRRRIGGELPPVRRGPNRRRTAAGQPRQALRVRGLRQDVRHVPEPRRSHADPHGPAAVQLRPVRKEVHPVGAPEVAPERALGRAAVRVHVVLPELHCQVQPQATHEEMPS
ncbi:zinc finger protein 469 [Perca flavescens]|uniref:zinc finger protein 469 n=1 Tax=Perca flavescens TaxID=8167 RepID=UPI00106EAB92|nr:zinc finger protein 469-like [Perca flavescens]